MLKSPASAPMAVTRNPWTVIRTAGVRLPQDLHMLGEPSHSAAGGRPCRPTLSLQGACDDELHQLVAEGFDQRGQS